MTPIDFANFEAVVALNPSHFTSDMLRRYVKLMRVEKAGRTVAELIKSILRHLQKLPTQKWPT